MIREYLRMRRTLFLLWAAACVTSLASAAAYGAGMEAAQYGLLMLTFLLALFCAGGVLVSIPISVLFVIMQKFYVEGITSGADKG